MDSRMIKNMEPTAPLWRVEDVAEYLSLKAEMIRLKARRGQGGPQ